MSAQANSEDGANLQEDILWKAQTMCEIQSYFIMRWRTVLMKSAGDNKVSHTAKKTENGRAKQCH